MLLNQLKEQSKYIQALLSSEISEQFLLIQNYIDNSTDLKENIFPITESFIINILRTHYNHKLQEKNISTDNLKSWLDWKIALNKNKIMDIPEKIIKFIEISLTYKLLTTESDREDYLNSIVRIIEWHIEKKII